MYVLIAIVGLVASASAKDLNVGREEGVLKYEQNVTASPTIWRQEKNVTFNVSDSEVITKVVVTDRREDKNGEAAVVEGGLGHKNVTIELKSPAVFRGFDFEVQIYAKPEDDTQTPVDNDHQIVKDPFLQDTQVNNKQFPKEETKDVITNPPVSSTTAAPNSQDKVQHPAIIGQEDNQQVRPNRDIKGQENKQTVIPISGKDLTSTTTTEKSTQEEQKKDIGQETQVKGFVPMTNDQNWKETIDSIFKDQAKGTKSVDEQKPVTEKERIDVSGEDQQTEKSVQQSDIQQAKKQVNVPLPYINH